MRYKHQKVNHQLVPTKLDLCHPPHLIDEWYTQTRTLFLDVFVNHNPFRNNANIQTSF